MYRENDKFKKKLAEKLRQNKVKHNPCLLKHRRRASKHWNHPNPCIQVGQAFCHNDFKNFLLYFLYDSFFTNNLA